MAMAALVIDLGFARLTQRQMQTAADSAALEGLRGFGSEVYAERRDAARNLLAWHFDDDLDPTSDDGAFDAGTGRFGAGPLVEFSGGAGDPALAASRTMSVDTANPVYKPAVLDGTESADRFRVALGRGTADVPVADLYSAGPAVPYLFARGSLINRELIQNGIVVRGTGNAEGRRVLSVGLANNAASPVLPGLTPFSLELNYWNGLGSGVGDVQGVASGEIGTVGRFFTLGSAASMPLSVGRTLPTTANSADGTYEGYVPIYTAIFNGITDVDRVVGFGLARAEVTTGMTQTVTITRMAQVTIMENASAVPCYGLPLTDVESAAVVAANATVAESLLAPVSR
jgi:hypothetical protein